MISPACETDTSSLPMTASSSSRPGTNSSRMTTSSNSKADETESPTAAASLALATPMEEPRLAGFTKRGSPSAAIASSMTSGDQADRCTRRQAATGMPLSCSTDLAMPLSMQTAEDSTPAPT